MLICEFEHGKKAHLRHVVVDNIILKDNKILLVKRALHLSNGEKYGLPGGFMERDETIEEAVRREIYEETGLKVDIHYLFAIIDNPNRRNENRQNMAFVYVGSAQGEMGMSDDEVLETKWFPLDALPPQDMIAFDHYDIIERYRSHLANPSPLPVFIHE